MPCETISNNAGVEGRATVEKILAGAPGYNAHTDQFVDMIEAGIVDPTKGVRVNSQDLLKKNFFFEIFFFLKKIAE